MTLKYTHDDPDAVTMAFVPDEGEATAITFDEIEDGRIYFAHHFAATPGAVYVLDNAEAQS